MNSPNTLPAVDAGEEQARPASAANDQWSIIWRSFCRNRLAVVSAGLILALITISVFAPVLASGAPLWYRGYNRFQYLESRRILRALANELKSPSATPASRARVLRSMELHTGMLHDMLPFADQEKLQGERAKLGTAVRQGTTPLDPIVDAFRKSVQTDLDPARVQLTSRDHYPALAGVSGIDLFFMCVTLALLTFPLWNRWLPRRSQSMGISPATWWRFVILFVLPGVIGLVWWTQVPSILDRTPYSQAVSAADTTERIAAAPVVYERVLWPLVPYDLDGNDLNHKYAAPSAAHWLGTDDVGRDVMSRMIWGGRVSLAVGIVAVTINILLGVIVGAIAGYFRGIWDLIISRIIEIVICFPSFFLILTIIAFVGPSIFNIMLVIGLIGWTGIAQLVRGEFLRLGEQEFILAARALGFSSARIIFLHVLPNAMAPVLVSATFDIAGAILTESGLSFLGMGITAPRPSWGGILASGREAVRLAPWLIYFPGLVIFLTITAYNLVGETLRDAADPRLRGRR